MSFDEAVRRKGLSFDKDGNLLVVNRVFVFTPKERQIRDQLGAKLGGIVRGLSLMASNILILYTTVDDILIVQHHQTLTLRYLPHDCPEAKAAKIKGDDFYLAVEHHAQSGSIAYWEGKLKFL